MRIQKQLDLNGNSGQSYSFNYMYMVHDADIRVNTGAVYILIRLLPQNAQLVYCGQTNNLRGRLADHIRDNECAFRVHQADCICYMEVENEQERERIERDILIAHNFPCNDQHQ